MDFLRRTVLAAAVLLIFAAPAWTHKGMEHKESAEGAMTMPMDSPGTGTARAASKSELAMFFSHLRKPEYIHVLINPIPIFGMGLGLLFLIIAWFRPAAGLAEAGLAIVIATGVVTYPTIKLGQKAYDRIYETIPLEGQMWLDVHMDRAEKFQYLFYLAAVLAAGVLLTRRSRPLAAQRLMLATMATSGLCAGSAGLIAHAGGQARHSEFRESAPPAGALKKAPAMSVPGREESPSHAH